MSTRRAVIYARISKASEESVSIERQLEAGRQYAAARGWQVVGEYLDDGVSATRNHPQERAGWRALVGADVEFDTVVIWKIDRLARRISDFWDEVKGLGEAGRTLVSIQDNLDMATTIGQTVAGVLAGFAQMEAEAISERVRASRTYLVKAGRVVGGTIPYGWRSIKSPGGPGRVLAQDPERIEYVRGAAGRVRAGASVYSVVQWLDEQGAPLPGASQKNRKREGWTYSTVERILRHPVLAGMTPFNPGNSGNDPSGKKIRRRGTEVRRGEDGLPVVDESVAIMSVADWRAMVKSMDERGTAQTKPRALRSKTSPLLSGLVACGHCVGADGEPQRMYRGTTNGRPGYSCRSCHQTISNIEDYVIAEFLRQKGERVRWSIIEEVHEGGAALLPEIEHRLDELGVLIRDATDRERRRELQEQQSKLLDLRDEKRKEAPRREMRAVRHAQTFGEDWAGVSAVEERRAVLDDALERVVIVRGRVGRGLDTSRLQFTWKMPEDLGPIVAPDNETLAAWTSE